MNTGRITLGCTLVRGLSMHSVSRRPIKVHFRTKQPQGLLLNSFRNKLPRSSMFRMSQVLEIAGTPSTRKLIQKCMQQFMQYRPKSLFCQRRAGPRIGHFRAFSAPRVYADKMMTLAIQCARHSVPEVSKTYLPFLAIVPPRYDDILERAEEKDVLEQGHPVLQLIVPNQLAWVRRA
jgi:hypothetical protein